MSVFWLLAVLALGIANFIFSVRILREAAGRGARIGFFELRWQVHRHLKAYREATRSRLGRVGADYYGYWATLVGLGIALLGLFYSLSSKAGG